MLVSRFRHARPIVGALLAPLLVLGLASSCRFDPAYRDFPEPVADACTDGVVECRGASLVRCVEGKPVVLDDCGARGQACAPQLLKCTPCLPGELTCEEASVLKCDPDGQKRTQIETCDGERGYACRRGSCIQLCEEASRQKSNIGCEYWAVDLDNAVTAQGNAALYAAARQQPAADGAMHFAAAADC